MADKLIEQEVVVSVNQALKAIEELQKKVDDLTDKLEENSKGQEKNSNEQNKNTNQTKKQAKEINNLSKALKGAKNSADSVVASLRKMTGISFAKLVNNASKLGRGLYQMLGQSINASEQLNMFNVVFGNMEKDGEKVFSDLGLKATRFQNQLNELFSTNKVETLQMQALFQSLATNTGVQADVAEKMSERMVYLTYDLASLYNKDEGDVAKAIQSGVYAGQTRPMRQVGVDLTQNNLGVTLQELGINDKAVSDLSQAEKQVLRYITAVRSASVANNDFAHTINSPANQLKILKQQFVELSIAIGNLFMRAFANILPYVNAIIMVVKEVLKTIALFFGIETEDYNTAQGSIGDLAGGYDDVGDSANNATKAVKELKRQTLSFDQINNLTSPSKQGSSGGGGSGGGGAIGAIDQRLIDALDKYDLKLDNVHNKAREIRDRLMEWLGFTKEIDEQTGEVTFKFGLINKSAVEIAEIYGAKLAEGLNQLTEKIDFEEIGEKLANGLNVVTTFINSFFETYNFSKLGTDFALGFDRFINDIDAESLGKSLTQKIRAIFDTAFGFVTTVDWSELGVKIADFLNGALKNVDFKKIAETIRVAIEGILTAIGKIFTNFDWGSLFKNLISGFNNLNGVLKGLVIATVAKSVFEFSKNCKTSIDHLKEVSKKTKEWYENASPLEQKLTNIGVALGGIVTMVAGFTTLKNAFKDMAENGVNFGNVIEAISGGVMAMAGAWAVAQIAVKVFVVNAEADLTTLTGGLYAVVILIGTLVSAFLGFKEASEIDETMENNASATKSYKEQLEELHREQQKSMETTAYELVNYKHLEEELSTLIDENGKVKEGYEERVKIILGKLNDGIGTELTLDGKVIKKNGEVVTSYKEIRDEIYKNIESRKKQAYLEVYEEEYNNRLKDRIEMQKTWNRLTEDTNELQELYNDAVARGDEADIQRYDNQLKQNELQKRWFLEAYAENEKWLDAYDSYSLAVKEGFDDTSEYYQEATRKMKEVTGISYEDMEALAEKAYGELGEYTKDVNKEIKDSASEAKGEVKGVKKEIDNIPNSKTVEVKTKTTYDTKAKNLFSVITQGANILLQTVGKADGGIFKNNSWKPVQQYASGGLPSTGQLFMAREAGPELVGKIGNATAVMNNNQIVSSVASGVAQAVKGVMTGNSGGIEVYVHTDEGVVVDRINRITKRTGECPIQI